MASIVPSLQNQGGTGNPTSAQQLQTPWLDFASTVTPDSHDLVLWWAQFMWLTDGNYRSAMKRVAAHFMTVIQFPDLEPKEESAWREFFLRYIDYRRELLACAHDFLVYGNLFVSLYLPFNRFARCQGCGVEAPIARVDYTMEMTDNASKPLVWHRKHKCTKCGNSSPYEVFDRRSNDLSKVRFNRWSPFEIQLAQNRYSLRKEIFWKIPEHERSKIHRKARIHIDDTPMEVLEAVALGGTLKFDQDIIFHIEETTVSGMNVEGWGIPGSIANFRTAWLQQLVNKADQAVAIDYTLGMRVISPAPTPGGTDPMQSQGQQNFTQHINSMVGQHRKNPASYHTAPYPLQYQFMGGEGGQLVPPDKLKFRHQEYMNQLGVPLEYHQMNLSASAAPMALRMFESYWQCIPSFYNNILSWAVKILTKSFDLDETRVEMQKTTVVDDMQYKQLLLQLMGGNQLSPQTALEPLGIDASNEVEKVLKHQDFVDRITQKYQEKASKREEMGVLKGMVAQPTASTLQQGQQDASGGQAQAGMPMGGMPTGGAPGQGNTGASLTQLSEQAAEIAQQIVSLSEFERKQQLKQLREGNKQLHALVKSELEDLRSQASAQGRAQLAQPPPGGQQGGAR